MKYCSLILFFVFSSTLYAQFSDEIILAKSETAGAREVYAIDIDGDGDNDVLSASRDDKKIAWYENLDGIGSFGPQQIISDIAIGVRSLYSVDMDGDGDTDVVAGCQHPDGKIVWYENLDGLGDFSDAIPIAVELDLVIEIYVGDLDNDGDYDVLSAFKDDDKIAWYENEDGLGTFSSQKIISTSIEFVEDVYAADFDGDGDQEAIVVSGCNSSIRWFEFAEEQGDFKSYSQSMAFNQFSWPISARTGDMDGDGDVDLIYNSDIHDKLSWFRNEDGQGNFGGELWISEQIESIKTAYPTDLDSDGDLDILYSGGTEIGWIKNQNGQANFSWKNDIDTGLYLPLVVYPADLDGDGDLDVLSASFTSDLISWYRNEDGQGNFSEEIPITTPGASGAESVISFDVDNDGWKDVVVAERSIDEISWFKNLGGAGSFSKKTPIGTSIDDPNIIVGADFDNDGYTDLLACSKYKEQLAWFKNTDGQLGDEQIIPITLGSISSLITVDMDGDADNDIIAASRSDDKIIWYENLGSGVFSSEIVIIDSIDSPMDILLEDIDNDGDNDMIVALSIEDKVSCFFNEAGNFNQEVVITNTANLPYKIMGTDIDQDGNVDLVISSIIDNKVAWYKNLGGGNFGDEIIINNNIEGTICLNSLDFDNDGDSDLLVSGSSDDAIYLFENKNGGEAFVQYLITNVANGISALAVTDIDLDGDDDIISSSYDDDKVAWYQNLLENTTITAICFLDENENNTLDPDEPRLNNQSVTILPNMIQAWTNSDGESHFVVDTGLYNLTAIPITNWELTSVQSVDVMVSSDSTQYTRYFGFHPNQDISSVDLTITSGPNRCGFVVPYWLDYKNNGTTVANGEINLTLDSLFSFVSASPQPNSINGQTLTWIYEDFIPMDSKNVFLELQMPGVEHIGEIMHTEGESVIFDDNNETIFSAVTDYDAELNCAYDPNDKLVYPNRGDENYITLEDVLEYTIRFQNTGTDTAFNIIITDVLDTNLDLNTFIPISASHDFEVKRYDDNHIEFEFPNILLPDSTTNLVLSQGYVKYQISPKTNLAPNTEIFNTANIYFDFNPPIITNTTLNTVVEELPVEIKEVVYTEINVNVFPNPFTDEVYFDLTKVVDKSDLQLMIYNSVGGKISSYNINNINLFRIGTQDFVPGMYFYSIHNKTTNELINSGKLISN